MTIYAVNSKEPTTAWIESLDPEVLTSSKATDLIGTNHGTLTNMDLTADPETSRIPDTDAGGVRALDFDGINDRVECGTTVGNFGSADWSISLWLKPPNATLCKPIISKRLNANPFTQWQILHGQLDSGANPVASKNVSLFIYNGVAFSSPNLQHYRTTNEVIDGNWMHVVVVRKADEIPKIFTNGVDQPLTAVRTGNLNLNANNAAKLCLANADGNASPYQCRLDDVRIFYGVALNQSDASYLYNSGSGRGRVAVSGESRRRQQSASGGVL
jgi:hypothetical protein